MITDFFLLVTKVGYQGRNLESILGTVQGHGYNCKTDKVGLFKGSNNGIWNKISYWTPWILDLMEELDETYCNAE